MRHASSTCLTKQAALFENELVRQVYVEVTIYEVWEPRDWDF